MPSLGADMDAGSIVEWRVRPGDRVHRGDVVAVVDTDKSDIEVEVFEDGVVDALLVEPGQEVAVGTVLARIGAPAAEAGAAAPPAPVPVTPPAPTAVVPPAPAPVVAPPAAEPARRGGRRARRAAPERPAREPVAPFVRSSPLARKRAAAGGIDLGALTGSGPAGAVVAADVERVAEPETKARPPAPAPAPEAAPARSRAEGTDRQEGMRRAIAAAMARSKREIPHYYLATTVDMKAALDWLAAANVERSVDRRILPAALLLKATALAAREHPAMNGFWVDDGFQPAGSIHLGVAVSLRGGGLIAPALHDADGLSLDELMAAFRDLVARVRSGRLRGSEMADPTLTVTSLGDQGVEEVFGVIHPPQVALVGFGRIAEQPRAVGGLLGVRPVVRATLAADHRASDGHDGARFLTAIDRLLQTPEAL